MKRQIAEVETIMSRNRYTDLLPCLRETLEIIKFPYNFTAAQQWEIIARAQLAIDRAEQGE